MKKYLSIMFALALITSLFVFPAVASATDVGLSVGVYDNVFDLENKDGNWAPITGDGIGALFGYNNASPTFDYGLSAQGLSASTDFSLIYYADTEDRFVDWGGLITTGVGTVIASGTSTASGTLALSGSVELNMDLPCPPDANAYFYDYTLTPDFYDHATGAKIWLIPTSVLTSGVMPVATWAPDNDWLFETDLVNYDDTDVVSDIIAISVSPDSVDFGILAPGITGDGGTLTVANIGNVSVDVSATIPSAGVFQYILLDGVGTYNVTIPYLGDDDVDVTLPVPGGYTPTGDETDTLMFTATKT